MRIRALKILFLCATAYGLAYADQRPTAESRGSFVKITDAAHINAPENRDAPDVLYVRRTAILRISLNYTAPHTEYRVVVAISEPAMAARSDDKVTLTDNYRSYVYTFPDLPSATAFAESLIAEKNG